MFAFLAELVILFAALLCVDHEQRPWVFLIGIVVIVTPVWVLLGVIPICVGAFIIHRFLRLRRKKRYVGAVLTRQLTPNEWRNWKSL